MTQIQTQLDNIIFRLKRNEKLKNIRFVRAYGTHKTELPIAGMIAVVSLMESALKHSYIGDLVSGKVKGEQYSANVQLRLYVPASENGAGLSEAVGEIMTSLKNADENRIITEISASPIAFDSDINSIYRNISFGVDFCLCEEATDE